MRIYSILAAAAATILAPTTSAHAEIVPPFEYNARGIENPTLAGELEQLFSQFLGDCPGLSAPLQMYGSRRDAERRRNGRPVSAIDPGVINELSLVRAPREIRPALDQTVANLFAFVSDSEGYFSTAWPSSRFLDVDRGNLERRLAAGFSSRNYETSCGRYLHAAGEAGGGFSFPLVSLRAALEAEFEGNSRNLLYLSHGTFPSPIWDMWQGIGAAPGQAGINQTFVGLLFWDWYVRNGADPDENRQMLSRFDGVVVYRVTSTRSTTTGSGDLRGRLSIPFIFRASGSGAADFSLDTTFDVNDFNVFVFRDSLSQRSVEVVDFPSLTEVVDRVRSAVRTGEVDYGNGSMLPRYDTKYVSFDLYGIPDRFCDASEWQVRDDAEAALESTEFSIQSFEQNWEGPGAPFCRVTVGFRSNGSETGRLERQPALVSARSVGERRLVIDMPTFEFVRVAPS